MPTKEAIRALLIQLDGGTADALEGEDLEFKPWDADTKALHRVLREAVVCLANARGGTVVVGVRDRVRTRREAIQGVGSHDAAGLRRAIFDGTDPHILVDIEELAEPEGRLLLVQVPRGMPPHSTVDGVTKIRVGKECKPLTGSALTRLLAAGGQRDPTAELVPGAKPRHLSARWIAALRARIQPLAAGRELARLSEAKLLDALGLLTDGEVTLAALLLVGDAEALARFAPQHEVVLLRHTSRTRYDQRRDLRGPILEIIPDVEAFVAANNRIRTVKDERFAQIEFPDLSDEVAREAVLNALLHRDYFLRASVQVALYPTHLEVTSPGGFVGGVSPENILRHPPVHRNELLARVAQTIGLVNRVGVGVDRIYEDLLRLGKGLPRYSADEAHVRLALALTTDERFALFVRSEAQAGRDLDLDDLLTLERLTRVASLDRRSGTTALQLEEEEETALRLAALRERGYLVVRGRGRTAAYSLRGDLRVALRGRGAADAEASLDVAAVQSRILALLRERGRLTNADVRRLSGFNRVQAYRVVKGLEAEGELRLVGHGRGAAILPVVRRT